MHTLKVIAFHSSRWMKHCVKACLIVSFLCSILNQHTDTYSSFLCVDNCKDSACPLISTASFLVDNFLCFGSSSAPSIFPRIASAVARIRDVTWWPKNRCLPWRLSCNWKKWIWMSGRSKYAQKFTSQLGFCYKFGKSCLPSRKGQIFRLHAWFSPEKSGVAPWQN